MEELERLRLQVKIMANTIDTQEKIIEELRRVLPQANDKSVCGKCGGKTYEDTFGKIFCGTCNKNFFD